MSRFQLPILTGKGEVTPEQLLRVALHAEDVYERQLGDRVALPFAMAIMSNEFSLMHSANQIREVGHAEGLTPDEMVQVVEAGFAKRNLTCGRWTFEVGYDAEPLKQLLQTKGFQREINDLWVLKEAKVQGERHDLTVIPGRAGFQKMRELTQATKAGRLTPPVIENMVRASERYLDEPVVDSLLALQGEVAVGMINMVTEGEMGFISEVSVHPAYRQQKVATTLLARMLDVAGRAQLKRITLFCHRDNDEARALYAKMGFEIVATVEMMELKEPT